MTSSRSAERGTRRPQLATQRPKQRQERRENAEFVGIALLVQSWDQIAPFLVEALFSDDVYRRSFLAVAESGGDLVKALDLADPEAREVLERAAVVDVNADAGLEARNLIGAAVRRELKRSSRQPDAEIQQSDRDARVNLEELERSERGLDVAGWLLGWLEGRMEARTGGV